MQPNIKQIIKFIGVGLFTLIVGYVIDIRFLQMQLHRAEVKQVRLKRLIKNRDQEAHKLKIGGATRETLLTPGAIKLSSFNGDFNIVDIIKILEQATNNSQTQLQLLEPQAIIEEEALVIYPIKLEVSGCYMNMVNFINSIFKQPYFVVFKELELQRKGNDNEELRMQALLMAYKNKIPLPKSTVNEQLLSNNAIKTPERDIFTKTVGKVNLFLWSCSELRFLGILQQGQITYGIVSDPLGNIHRVRVGDKIGLKESKVITINKQGIATINKSENIFREE